MNIKGNSAFVQKINNNKAIYNCILTYDTFSVADITKDTDLSYNTVNRFINILKTHNILSQVEDTQISVGRPQNLYKINPNSIHSLLVYTADSVLYVKVINLKMDVIFEYAKTINMLEFLNELKIATDLAFEKIEFINNIIAGVNGVILDGVIKQCFDMPNLTNFNLKEYLEQTYQVKASVYNNIKVITYSANKYVDDFKNKIIAFVKSTNKTYVFAFLINGKLLMGNNGYAGETNADYPFNIHKANSLKKWLLLMNSFFNPSDIIYLGDNKNFETDFSKYFKEDQVPTIHYSENFIDDAFYSLSHIANEKIYKMIINEKIN